MAIGPPPVWLIRLTAACYLGFFAYASVASFTLSLDQPTTPDGVDVGSFDGFFDTVSYLFEFVTFGFIGGDIPIPTVVSGLLFLICDAPWILYFLGILQEVIDTVNPF